MGGETVEDPLLATHLITGYPLKRTPKIMIALNSGVVGVVAVKWLEESAEARQPLPVEPYLIRDEAREQQWGFTMPDTLTRRSKSLV